MQGKFQTVDPNRTCNKVHINKKNQIKASSGPEYKQMNIDIHFSTPQ